MLLRLPHSSLRRDKKMRDTKGDGGYCGALMKVALPIWAFFFFQAIYGVFDLLFIGNHYRTYAVAAAATGSQIIYIMIILISGMVTGIVPAIASALRQGDREKAERVFSTSVLFFGLGSVILALFLYLNIDVILDLMATPEEAVKDAREYLSIALFSLPAATAYIIAGCHDSLSGRYSKLVAHVAFGAVLNIILSRVFAVNMKMGVRGIAVSTLTAQTVCAITYILEKAVSSDTVKLRLRYLKFDRKIIGEIFHSGNGEALQNGIINFSMLFITALINRRGVEDAAAAGIVEKIITLLLTFPLACRSTTVTMCSFFLGGENRNTGRAKKTNEIMLTAVTLYGALCVLTVTGTADGILSLFSADRGVIEAGSGYLRGYVWEILFGGIHYIYTGYLVASGMTMMANANSITAMVFVRIPFAYVASLVYVTSLYEIGLAATAGSVLLTVIGTFTYFYVLHRKRKAETAVHH